MRIPNTGIPAFTACIILKLVTRIWRTFASTAATARTRIIENLFRTLERLLLVKFGVFFFFRLSLLRAEREYFHMSSAPNPKKEILDVIASFLITLVPILHTGRESAEDSEL